MKLSLVKYIFNGIPETILLIYVSLGLIDAKMDIKDYLKIAIVNVFIIWIVRDLFGLFGLHSFILIATIILLIKSSIEVATEKLIISMLISLIILYIGETVTFSIFFDLFNIDIKVMNHDLKWYFSLSYISKVPLVLTAVLIYRFKFRIFSSRVEQK